MKPHVKRGENDAADAEAICEAVTRPTVRFVGVKTVEQQSIMMLHRVRLILMRQRTQLSNALRSHLAEFGIVSAIGRVGLDRLLTMGVLAVSRGRRVASRPFENARFTRENPRKSNSIFPTRKPLSKELQAIPIRPAS